MIVVYGDSEFKLRAETAQDRAWLAKLGAGSVRVMPPPHSLGFESRDALVSATLEYDCAGLLIYMKIRQEG